MDATISTLQPVRMTRDGDGFTAEVWGRRYAFGADAMLQSVQSGGRELLSAPIRLVGDEAGEQMVWNTDYAENESRAFVALRTDEEVVLCGAMRSKR